MRAEVLFWLFYFSPRLVIFDVLGFNIDTNNPIIYLDQSKYIKNVNSSRKTSFFGFSVILVPGVNNQSWLQIGAPRANSPSLRQYENPGIIFRCTIPKPCEYIEIDKNREPIATKTDKDKFDDAWIGASMDVNLNYNRTVVCAPRWINAFKYGGVTLSHYLMLGACYWADLQSKTFNKMLPLLADSKKYFNMGVYNWGQGEAGLSVHMPEDKEEMFIGAPGVFNWKGTAMVYRDAENVDISPKASKLRLEGSKEKFESLVMANAQISGDLASFDLFGYAVTSGHFFSKRQLHYVGGAPRARTYLGQVLICHFGENDNQKLNVVGHKRGLQFGEYYGAALAAGDINQDGYDDLFVGAPFYHSSKYNVGRIFLYLGSKKGSLEDPVKGKVIEGSYTNGQFGAAITFIGDMNGDGNRYVAVSAPYADEGSGELYIFKGLGESYGLDAKPVQKIMGKTFLPNIRGFGISISKPADIDNNEYKDIAVGAYQSGHVVLLRSRPLVIVNSTFTEKPMEISSEQKVFSVKICHEFSSIGGPNTIRISRKILVDKNFNRASLTKGEDNTTFTLQKEKPKCETLDVKLRTSNIYDSLDLEVTHFFIEETPNASKLLVSNSTQEMDGFCKRCGVYDKFRSRQTAKISIPYSLGCGSDKVCDSSLSFNSSFNISGRRSNTFIRGSANDIDLEIEVSNDGERAYNLFVQVDLPKELSFKKRPSECEQLQSSSIKCPFTNPLDGGQRKPLSTLKLDMDYVNSKIDKDYLYINVTLLTTSKNKNESFRRIKLNLKTEADITISGASESYAYGNVSNSIVEFEQTYSISKFGSSPVNSVAFQIYVPYAIRTETENSTFITLSRLVVDGPYMFVKSELPTFDEALEGISSYKMVNMGNDDTKNIAYNSNVQDTADDKLLGTATYKISCNRTDVLCGWIHGHVGPFSGTKNSVVLQLRFLMDFKNISGSGFLQKNAVIGYSTSGVIEIKDPPKLNQSGKRPDAATVSTIFKNYSKKVIELWIIIVSAVLGFLLLILLTFGLTKAGFFERAKLEELKQLKAQTDQTNTVNPDNSDLPQTE